MNEIFTHLADAAVLIAVATGCLYFLGARSEQAYLEFHGISFYQFMPPGKDLIFKGWERLIEYAKRRWHIVVVLLLAVHFFWFLDRPNDPFCWGNLIWLKRTETIALTASGLLAAFCWSLIRFARWRGIEVGYDRISKSRIIALTYREKDTVKTVEGYLITYANGLYAVRECGNKRVYVWREEQLDCACYHVVNEWRLDWKPPKDEAGNKEPWSPRLF